MYCVFGIAWAPPLLIDTTRPLLARSDSEDPPQRRILRAVCSSLPDQALLDGQQQAHAYGREDYPITVLWGVPLVSFGCRDLSIEDCLNELRRHPTLCRLK